jgi:hypothetical protein
MLINVMSHQCSAPEQLVSLVTKKLMHECWQSMNRVANNVSTLTLLHTEVEEVGWESTGGS